MAPPVGSFDPQDLASKIQRLPNGCARKPRVDLKDCQLLEMLQYECNLDGPRNSVKSRIVCEPVLRLFRKCANGFTVEVTAFKEPTA